MNDKEYNPDKFRHEATDGSMFEADNDVALEKFEKNFLGNSVYQLKDSFSWALCLVDTHHVARPSTQSLALFILFYNQMQDKLQPNEYIKDIDSLEMITISSKGVVCKAVVNKQERVWVFN